MGLGEINVEEQALIEVSSNIESYITNYCRVVETLEQSVSACSGEWQDEDFENLTSLLKVFSDNAQNIQTLGQTIVQKIGLKVEVLQEIHRLKI